MTIIYDLDCVTEEAGCRLILHIAKSVEEHFNIIIVVSNDTDFNLVHYEQLKRVNIEKVWIRFRVQPRQDKEYSRYLGS